MSRICLYGGRPDDLGCSGYSSGSAHSKSCKSKGSSTDTLLLRGGSAEYQFYSSKWAETVFKYNTVLFDVSTKSEKVPFDKEQHKTAHKLALTESQTRASKGSSAFGVAWASIDTRRPSIDMGIRRLAYGTRKAQWPRLTAQPFRSTRPSCADSRILGGHLNRCIFTDAQAEPDRDTSLMNHANNAPSHQEGRNPSWWRSLTWPKHKRLDCVS